jgi:hypothetical protein
VSSEVQHQPAWLPDSQILLAQLAAGINDYVEITRSVEPFTLPYPSNLQTALNKLTMLCWRHQVAPPSGVVELLEWAGRSFADWPVTLALQDVDADESLLWHGAPTPTCEELGTLRGDVEGEIRENRTVFAVMEKARAHKAPDSYVAFRRLLIEQPLMSLRSLDQHLARPELAMLSAEIRDAYPPVPPEGVADGVVRTCAGCRGLRLSLDRGRHWYCTDASCPDPGRAGPDLAAAEGVVWLRRDLRTFIVGPGRAELRIAAELERRGVAFELWPDFDAYDLAVFSDRRWVVDVKAWRNPTRLGGFLRQRPFEVAPWADRGFVVIATEQVNNTQRYVERLRRACPDLRATTRAVAMSERSFLRQVDNRRRGRSS